MFRKTPWFRTLSILDYHTGRRVLLAGHIGTEPAGRSCNPFLSVAVESFVNLLAPGEGIRFRAG